MPGRANTDNMSRSPRLLRKPLKKPTRLHPNEDDSDHLPSDEETDEPSDEDEYRKSERSSASDTELKNLKKPSKKTRKHDRGDNRRNTPVPSPKPVAKPNTFTNIQAHRTHENTNDATSIVWLILGIAVVIGGVLLVMYSNYYNISQENVESSDTIDYFQLYNEKHDDVEHKFSNQSPRFWKIIKSALKRLLKSQAAKYPAVIIVTVPEGFSHIGTCIAKEIVGNVNAVFSDSGQAYIDSTSLNNASPAKTKLDLDQRLIDILSSRHSVVLDHIDALPAQAALLLHGYSDGDNAPYKNSAIFLVLHTNKRHGEITETFVEKTLTERWRPVLGMDEMPALLSRIANNIAIMSPEHEVSCKV